MDNRPNETTGLIENGTALPSEAVDTVPAPVPQKAKKRGALAVGARIAGNLVFVFFLFTIAALVFSMVQSRITGQPPTVAGHQMYIVLSGSMSPAFDTGNLAFLKPVEAGSIEMGDIITFRTRTEGESLTTHRVAAVHQDGGRLSFTTRGDANEVNDPVPVPAENVVGKITFAVPYAGYLMSFGQTQTGLLTLVIIPGVLIIIFELRNLFRYATQWDEEKKVREEAQSEARGEA